MEKGVIKPDYQTYVALGQAYYFTDQPAQAIENYRKAAPLAPDGETYLNLARILWGEGQLGEAKQAAQKALDKGVKKPERSEEHTSELQSLMRISYAVFCLKKKKIANANSHKHT